MLPGSTRAGAARVARRRPFVAQTTLGANNGNEAELCAIHCGRRSGRSFCSHVVSSKCRFYVAGVIPCKARLPSAERCLSALAFGRTTTRMFPEFFVLTGGTEQAPCVLRRAGIQWTRRATPFQYLCRGSRAVEKLMHQRPDTIPFFFQREMARVEKMELCTGNISFEELRTLHRKNSVVFAPSDQQGGLMCTEVLLPIVENIQISFRIVEDRKLDILVSRPVLVGLVDHPIVRADLRRITRTMQIMPLGSFIRQKPVE